MTLFLLPNLLADLKDHRYFLAGSVDRVVETLDGLIAESEPGGRRFLKRFNTKKKAHLIPIASLDDDPSFLLEPIISGENWGILSDAGLPCLADPGARLVFRARTLNLHIETLVGPSAITLALIQSGLPGQQFFFHGYIPKDPHGRQKALREWEKMGDVTHIFIEAPYRNVHTFETCLASLKPSTVLSLAAHLTHPEQWIYTAPIDEWRSREIAPPIEKTPTVFLFAALNSFHN